MIDWDRTKWGDSARPRSLLVQDTSTGINVVGYDDDGEMIGKKQLSARSADSAIDEAISMAEGEGYDVVSYRTGSSGTETVWERSQSSPPSGMEYRVQLIPQSQPGNWGVYFFEGRDDRHGEIAWRLDTKKEAVEKAKDLSEGVAGYSQVPVVIENKEGNVSRELYK